MYYNIKPTRRTSFAYFHAAFAGRRRCVGDSGRVRQTFRFLGGGRRPHRAVACVRTRAMACARPSGDMIAPETAAGVRGRATEGARTSGRCPQRGGRCPHQRLKSAAGRRQPPTHTRAGRKSKRSSMTVSRQFPLSFHSNGHRRPLAPSSWLFSEFLGLLWTWMSVTRSKRPKTRSNGHWCPLFSFRLRVGACRFRILCSRYPLPPEHQIISRHSTGLPHPYFPFQE